MSRARTVFVRVDRDARAGRADVAHVRVVRDADGAEVYVGEVSGTETVADAELVLHITTENPWQCLADNGYTRPADVTP